MLRFLSTDLRSRPHLSEGFGRHGVEVLEFDGLSIWQFISQRG